MKLFKNRAARRAAVLFLLVLTASLLTFTALANDMTIRTEPAENNLPPVAENLEFTTFKGVAVTGRLSGMDPDGDVLSFEVVSGPRRGEVAASENGEFTYTPKDGAKGKDSFAYVAVDAAGNVSGDATVSVTIKKQTTKTTYADMSGSGAQYAALVLSEKGVFTGEKLGGQFFFRPDEPVSRGEFLAMCLDVAGVEALGGVTRTGFYDDAEIPAWVKPYVSTALMNGVVKGYKTDEGRLVFAPQNPVTFSEAAVMLNKVLNVTDVMSVAAVEAEAVPAWAYSAAVNLSACKILPSGVSDYCGDAVTRGDAAQILLASMELLENRDAKASLLGWAK
ncbi:MAG: S-layer homology domain-containing protein [Oscillospiraceae bacterium]|nr:S-layer homology domain-containing protein [Oscillospiraceae bacterium]